MVNRSVWQRCFVLRKQSGQAIFIPFCTDLRYTWSLSMRITQLHVAYYLVIGFVLLVDFGIAHTVSTNAVAQARLHTGAETCASRTNSKRAMVTHSYLSSSSYGSSKREMRTFVGEIESGSCTADAEVTEGPYYVRNELQRSDVRDNEPGVPLILQFRVIDISNCSAVPYASVEIWHTNSTGSYAHFTGVDPDTGSMKAGATCVDSTGKSLQSPSPSPSDTSTSTTTTTSSEYSRDVTQNGMPPMPPMVPGPRPPMPPGGRPGGSTTCMTDYLTFNRGWQVTGSDGTVQMTTNYPGFYTGRTPHIHVMVRTSDTQVNHIGQFFFNETITQEVYEIGDYAAHIAKVGDIWLRLASDGIYQGSGQTPINMVRVDEDNLAQGLVGAVTIYIDSTASQSISSTNYLTDGPVSSAPENVTTLTNGTPPTVPESNTKSTLIVSFLFLGLMGGILSIILAHHLYDRYKNRDARANEVVIKSAANLFPDIQEDPKNG